MTRRERERGYKQHRERERDTDMTTTSTSKGFLRAVETEMSLYDFTMEETTTNSSTETVQDQPCFYVTVCRFHILNVWEQVLVGTNDSPREKPQRMLGKKQISD